MTYNDLIEKVAGIVFHHELEEEDTRETAAKILKEVFDALQNPTEAMCDGSRHLMMWLSYDRPTGHALHFMHNRMGKPLPDGCGDIDHVPPKAQQAAWVWQAMLPASPLMPANAVADKPQENSS